MRKAYLEKRVNKGKSGESRPVPAPQMTLGKARHSSSTLRRCYICKKLKPLEEFVRDKSRSSGFGYSCKICNRLRNRVYHEQHSSDRAEYFQDYRKNNKECRLREAAREKRNRPIRRIQEIARTKTTIAPSCVLCGSTENLERHHPDYNKPFEIVTLCRRCHQRIHNPLVLTVEGAT